MKPIKKTVTVGDILDMVRKGEINLDVKVIISLEKAVENKNVSGRHKNKQY